MTFAYNIKQFYLYMIILVYLIYYKSVRRRNPYNINIPNQSLNSISDFMKTNIVHCTWQS
jgi:hypothetical protein